MAEIEVNGVPVQDDYSETFAAQMVRVLVTSVNAKWAREAAWETKGLGRSATAPPCEATVEREVGSEETPDGRPGFIIQMMDRKAESLQKCLALRLRKGAVPNPKTNVFDALPSELAEDRISLDDSVIAKFGDGFEEVRQEFGREVYRIPRMDGWLHIERSYGIREAVTGGMFLILAKTDEEALAAAEETLERVGEIPLVVVKCAASGSKVGANTHTDMVATINDKYCPTLLPLEGSHLWPEVGCVYEIIVSGPTEEVVREGMKVGIEAATGCEGVLAIHTANYGGKLGKGKISLPSLWAEG
ncbi:hypothetical protein [Stratiformator vulcanicus]|uniref:Formyltransferase/hydrolase complex subunit D n=1 Tax=Stratiformator vulcanicus TaxID=2527980 RepID=A0A517R2X7_9PLAN|nr:hypothetical protein [Stratiformator vulcanicus]QDT38236.1 Formyltransferase/hydrolase complex subunit D [Stratiformator vulcanicus]